MTESHRAVISRLSEEFDALARQMSRVSGELTERTVLAAGRAGRTATTVTPAATHSRPSPTTAAAQSAEQPPTGRTAGGAP